MNSPNWLLALLLLVAVGCAEKPTPTPTPTPTPGPGPSPVSVSRGVVAEPGTTEVRTLSQNWTDTEASWFYDVPQGSYLVRYEWFLNLEQPDSELLFRDVAHIQSLGYLARKADTNNPDGLPIGFVKDDKPLIGGGVESYLGMTCAACHTGHVTFEGKMFVVDGAPTNGNFEKLQRELAVAMEATLGNDARFDRFATKVLGAIVSEADKSKLRTEVKASLEARVAYNERNLPAPGGVPFGHGRVDAFGSIMNEVAVRFAQVPGNSAPATAPVSYPVLWDAPQHDFVQWNGAAENKTSDLTKPLVGTKHIGALGRNTGEVFGVFGEVDATVDLSPEELLHYPNSAKRENLIAIEDSLRNLWSPVWPAEFPAIDPALKSSGKVLFEKHCAECHHSIVRNDPNRKVIAQLTDVKTDQTMALNFLTRTGKTGVLKGRRIEPLSTSLDLFGDEAPVGLILTHLVQRAILRSTPELLAQGKEHTEKMLGELQSSVDYTVSGHVSRDAAGGGDAVGCRFEFSKIRGIARRVRDLNGRLLDAAESALKKDASRPDEVRLNYKARPLNGIWASAPYLHNGSIPNLDELLKRANERSQEVFKVGSREYDPVKAGFKTDTGENFDPKSPGNLNAGHDYPEDGTSFTAEERKQLIEYMKSL